MARSPVLPAGSRWSHRVTPSVVAGGYTALGVLWIAASDWLFRRSPAWVSAVKGLLYVAATAAVLLWVLKRRERAIGERDGALRTTQARLGALADASADFTGIIDRRGRLEYLTESAHAVLGWRIDTLAPALDASLLHPDDVGRAVEVFSAVSNGGPGATGQVTVRGRHADRSWRWLACVLVNRLEDRAVGGVIAHVRDVTADHEQTTVITALLAGSARLAQASDEQEVAAAALEACLAAVGASGGAVRRLDVEAGVLVPVLTRDLDLTAHTAFCVDGPAPIAIAARTQAVVSLADERAIAAYPSGTVPGGLAAVVYIPMLISSRTVGTIGLGFTEPRELSRGALDSLLTFAHAAALALERTRLDAGQRAALVAAAEAAARTDALHRITRTVSGSGSVTAVLDVALEALVAVLRPGSATAVLRAGADLLRVVAVRGREAGSEPLAFSVDAGRPVCAVLRAGDARWYDDHEQYAAAFGPGEPVPTFGHAAAIVPLAADDAGPVGALVVLFDRPGPLSAADRDFAASVGMLCSEALRRIRLGEIERRAEARAAALHRVTESFSRSVTVEEVITAAVRGMVDALGPATAGATVRLDGERCRQWAWDLARGGALHERELAVAAASPVVAAVLADGRARFYETATAVAADLGAGVVHPFPIEAGAFMPLIIDGEPVGLLGVTFLAGRPLPESDRELLGGLAALCAEAMRRARHFEQAQRAAARYSELFASYERLFSDNPIPMVVYDDERRVLAANRALERAFGYDDATLATMSIEELLAEPEPAGEASTLWLSEEATAAGREVVRVRRRDGSTFFMAVSSHDAATFAGRPARVGLLVDQTARVEAEEANKALQARVIAVAEEERRRLAGDLHDGPVQQLSIASMRLSALRRRVAEDGDARVQLDKVEREVIATVDELRTMMQQLHPQGIAEVGLAEAIRATVPQLPWTAALRVQVDDRLCRDLPPTVQAALYRVAMEALQNVHKHASATSVVIELRDDGDAVALRITDDGVGIDTGAAAQPGHLGLPSMRDRVSLLGGECRIGRAGERGTVVEARLPLAATGAAT